jgi:hypothetical protein
MEPNRTIHPDRVAHQIHYCLPTPHKALLRCLQRKSDGHSHPDPADKRKSLPSSTASLKTQDGGNAKTYNRRDSQMVTHSSTSRPVQCLCMAERTGCPVLTDLWSYVSFPLVCTNMKIELSSAHRRSEAEQRRLKRGTLGRGKKANLPVH